jgi:Domain of unknown function (DUF4349)/Putative zinc-finger
MAPFHRRRKSCYEGKSDMSNRVHIAPTEEIMALLDGELSTNSARSLSAHLAECAGCRQFADSLRSQSESLANWTVPPASFNPQFEDRLFRAAHKLPNARPNARLRIGKLIRQPALLALVGSIAATLLFFSVTTVSLRSSEDAARQAGSAALSAPAPSEASSDRATRLVPGDELRQQMLQRMETDRLASSLSTNVEEQSQLSSSLMRKMKEPAVASGGGFAPVLESPEQAVTQSKDAALGTMIARNISLSVIVKDFAFSRTALDAILARHNGYSAQLNVNTPEGSARTLQASLRIPATQLAAAITDLKSLGRVESETQNGEEVTQQHADLVARLRNSRETEQRLQAILVQRTGKISDVLAVEQEMARVRGEIEQMEAEQKSLEHRVDFATIDLSLGEEYKAQLNSPSSSTSTRFHNAVITGYRDALETVIGIVLFFAHVTPSLLVWLALLLPVAWFLRRRWLRARAIGDSIA